MPVADLLTAIEASSLAEKIRASLYLFPLIESLHVIGLTLVFGTIVVIDLRLLGLASARRPFSAVASDTLKWTWAAFIVTAATGALMFSTNAQVYAANAFFQRKLVLLALAGLNMLLFELTARRSVMTWDRNRTAPAIGKAIAAASLMLWIGVIFMGRWVGFTVTRTAAPPDPGINIEDLLPK